VIAFCVKNLQRCRAAVVYVTFELPDGHVYKDVCVSYKVSLKAKTIARLRMRNLTDLALPL